MVIYWKLVVDGESFDVQEEDIIEACKTDRWYHPLSGQRIFDFEVRGRCGTPASPPTPGQPR